MTDTRVIAYHEAGHAVVAFALDIGVSDLYLGEDNGSVGYIDEGSIPDAPRIDLYAAGDAGAALSEGRPEGSPVMTGIDGDWTSAQPRIKRLLQHGATIVSDEECMVYFVARRDAMMRLLSDPGNRRALDAIAYQLMEAPRLSEQLSVPSDELDWRWVMGPVAQRTFEAARRVNR